MNQDIQLEGQAWHSETKKKLNLFKQGEAYVALPTGMIPYPELFKRAAALTALVAKGQYQHFKGKIYFVLYIALDGVTGEALVIYHELASLELWARPQDMFDNEITLPSGRRVKRFQNMIAAFIPPPLP